MGAYFSPRSFFSGRRSTQGSNSQKAFGVGVSEKTTSLHPRTPSCLTDFRSLTLDYFVLCLLCLNCFSSARKEVINIS